MQLVEIYRELDQNLLSEEAIKHLSEYELSSVHVLHGQPRDVGWTEEVSKATVAFLLVDAEETILARFDVDKYPTMTDAMRAAEKAAASASVRLDVIVPRDADEDESEPSLNEGLTAAALG